MRGRVDGRREVGGLVERTEGVAMGLEMSRSRIIVIDSSINERSAPLPSLATTSNDHDHRNRDR